MQPTGNTGWFDNPAVNFRMRRDDVQNTMDIYHVNASVTRLSKLTDGRYYPDWHRDPHDNETHYQWEQVGGYFRVKKVTNSFTGIEEHFNYTGVTGHPNQVDVTVSYTGVLAPGLSPGASELSWGYRVHTNGNLLRVWHPQRQVVIGPEPGKLPIENTSATPASPLYAVPATGFGDSYFFVDEFKWTTIAGRDYLTEKWEHHVPGGTAQPDLANPNTKSIRVLLNTYSPAVDNPPGGWIAADDMQRVATQVDRWGQQHSFTYEVLPVHSTHPGPFRYYVSKGEWVRPDNTRESWSRDHHGRVTSRTVTPELGASGRPRAAEAGSPHPEPTSVTWNYEYGSSGCGCSNPTKITEPSGRIHSYLWDPTTFFLLSETHPDPSANPGSTATVTTSYQYGGGWVSIPQTAQENGNLLKKIILPDQTEIEHVRVFQQARFNPAHGYKLRSTTTRIQRTSSAWIESSTTLDDHGRLDEAVDPGGTVTKFTYQDVALQQGYRHVLAITRGTGTEATTTNIIKDDLGRTHDITTEAGNSSVETRIELTVTPGDGQVREIKTHRVGLTGVTRLYYDVWDQLAVTQVRNLDSNGQPPAAPLGAPSTPREWIRSEYQAKDGRLLARFQDRRPLHEGAEPNDPIDKANSWLLATFYSYDQAGRLSTIIAPNGTTTTHTWDGYGTLFKTSSTSNDLSITLEGPRYYINDNLEHILTRRPIEHLGNTITVDYGLERNRAGLVVHSFTPTVGAPVGYTGNLGGQKTWFQRNQVGETVGIHTYQGTALVAKTQFIRDLAGRLTETREQIIGGPTSAAAQYRVTSQTLNDRGQPTLVTLPTGRKIRYTYDAKGRLKSVDDGQASSQITSTISYYGNSDLVAERQTSMVRNVLTGSGTTKTYKQTYNYGLGAVLQSVVDHGEIGGSQTRQTVYGINSLGLSDTVTDAAGRVHKHYHDAMGRVVASTDVGTSASRTVQAVYDDHPDTVGQTMVDRIDPKGFVTRQTFDFLGRQTILQRPGSDLASPPTSSNKHKAHAFYYEYDASGRMMRGFDGRGVQIDYHYDALDQLLIRESPNVGSLANQVSQLTVRDILSRDSLGRITQNGTFLGPLGPTMILNNAQTRSIDSVGRMHSEDFLYQGGPSTPSTITHAFSGTTLDDRTGLTYSSGSSPLSLQFGYGSALGRLSSVQMKLPGAANNLAALAEYAHMGGAVNQRKLHYNGTSHGSTSHDFDHFGRGSQIEDEIGSTTLAQIDFEYDLLDNLIKETYRRPSTPTGTGWAVTGDRFVYDDFNRLTEAWLGLNQANMQAPTPTTTGNGLKERNIYSLDQGSNRATENYYSPATSFTRNYSLEDNGTQEISNRYDSYTQSGGTMDIEHDAAGNLWRIGSKYFVFDIFNRLSEVYEVAAVATSSSSTSARSSGSPPPTLTEKDFQYARTSIQRKSRSLERIIDCHCELKKAGDLSVTFTTSRQSSATANSTSGGLPAEVSLVALYSYDVFNRRMSRVVVGESTYFHTYDGWRELEQLQVNGSAMEATQSFAWGDRLDEMLAYVKPDGQGGHDSYFIHQAGADSTHVVMDDQGNEVERVEYRASGEPEFYTPNGSGGHTFQAGGSTIGLPYAWHSKRHDPETGLVYNRYRYYSPELGRFVSVDPIGAWGDLANRGNSYSFADASSTRKDPLGLHGETSTHHGIPQRFREAAGSVGLDIDKSEFLTEFLPKDHTGKGGIHSGGLFDKEWNKAFSSDLSDVFDQSKGGKSGKKIIYTLKPGLSDSTKVAVRQRILDAHKRIASIPGIAKLLDRGIPATKSYGCSRNRVSDRLKIQKKRILRTIAAKAKRATRRLGRGAKRFAPTGIGVAITAGSGMAMGSSKPEIAKEIALSETPIVSQIAGGYDMTISAYLGAATVWDLIELSTIDTAIRAAEWKPGGIHNGDFMDKQGVIWPRFRPKF